VLWRSLLLLLALGLVHPALADNVLRLGVFAYRPKALITQQFQPLADYLTEQIADVRVVMQVLTGEEMQDALTRNQLDVLLTNPMHYMQLRAENSMSGALATIISMENGVATTSLGGVIITRHDMPGITTLSDLKNRHIAIPGTGFLGGYQAQAYELAQVGIRLPRDATLQDVRSHDAVVAAVLSQRAEVGFIRTGILEKLTAEGKLDPQQLRVIHPQRLLGFPYLVSTRLYPEWPFVVMPHVETRWVRKLAAALFALDDDHPAARAAGIAGFAPPADYLPVELLARELRLPPFDQPMPVEWRDVWRRYQTLLVTSATGLLLFLVLGIKLLWLNRRLQQSLAAERRFRTALDSVSAYIYIKDAESRYVYANRPVLELFGCSDRELVGRGDAHFFPPETVERLREIDRRVLAGETTQEEIITDLATGQHVFWEVKTPLYGDTEHRDIWGICGVSTDITEYKRQEQALRDSRDRLAAVLDVIPDLLFEVDLEGRIHDYHSSHDELLAVSPEVFLGRVFDQVLPREVADCLMAGLRHAHQTGHASGVQYALDIPHLGKRWFEAAIARKPTPITLLPEFVVLVRDITEKKRVHLALSELANKFVNLAGVPYYQAICEYLADALHLDYVFVGEILTASNEAQILASWADGAPLPPFRYDLTGTPCSDVARGRICVYEKQVCQMFPNDRLLAEMGIEAYCGIPLLDKAQHPIGLLVALHRAPLNDPDQARALLELFDQPLSAEMQRTQSDMLLRQRIALEQHVSDMATRLLAASEADWDHVIDQVLAAMGQFTGADRAYLFQVGEDRVTARHSHEWCAPNIPPQIDEVPQWLLDARLNAPRALLAGQAVEISDVAQLRDDWTDDRACLQALGIRAVLEEPLLANDQLIGFVGLDCVHAPRAWRDEDKTLLKLTREILTHALIRHRAEKALRHSEKRFRQLFDAVPIPIASTLRDERIDQLNRCFLQQIGYTHTDIPTVADWMELAYPDPDYRARAIQKWEKTVQTAAATNGIIVPGECRIRIKNGETRDVEISGTLVGDEMLVAMIDLTERNKTAAQLRLAASVFTHAREGIMITDDQATILDVNEAFCRMFGYTRKELIGKNPRLLHSGRQPPGFYASMWRALTEQGYWSGEIWNRHKNGEFFAEMLTISSIRNADHQITHYVALFTDITALKQHEQQLEYIAHYDVLTDLPNRVLLADRMQQAMARAKRQNRMLAVVFIDLDGFKAVNDCYGHAVGDLLLAAAARRMQSCLRAGDTIARLGGDEFVAVLIDLTQQQDSESLIARLIEAIAAPIMLDKVPDPLSVTASLGVTFYPQGMDIDPDQLLRQADQAMYQAKLAGKNRYYFFQ